jgi:hypothetical protein
MSAGRVQLQRAAVRGNRRNFKEDELMAGHKGGRGMRWCGTATDWRRAGRRGPSA